MNYVIDSQTLSELLKTGRRALNGDSNDAEHDALYEIVAVLETLDPEVAKEANYSDAQSL